MLLHVSGSLSSESSSLVCFPSCFSPRHTSQPANAWDGPSAKQLKWMTLMDQTVRCIVTARSTQPLPRAPSADPSLPVASILGKHRVA